MDRLGPDVYLVFFGVGCLEVVYGPQQMCPTSLVWPVMAIVGSVEVTHNSGVGRVAHHIFHHLARATLPILKVARRRCTETPEVAVLAILSPGGLVPMHHRARAQLLTYLSHAPTTVIGHRLQDGYDLPLTQLQSIDGLQVPLNDADWQPSFLSQGGDQHHSLQAHTVTTKHLAAQHVCLGRLPFLTQGTAPFNEHMLNHFHRRKRYMQYLPGSFDRTAPQTTPTLTTTLECVDYLPRRFAALASIATQTLLARLLLSLGSIPFDPLRSGATRLTVSRRYRLALQNRDTLLKPGDAST